MEHLLGGRGGVDAEFVRKGTAQAVVRGHGVGRALRPVQGRHQMTVERLAQRMGGGVAGDVGGDRAVAACVKVEVELQLDSLQVLFDEVNDFRGVVKRGKFGHRPAAPQGQCRGAFLPEGLPVARPPGVLGAIEARAEDLGIQFTRMNPQSVGTPGSVQPVPRGPECRPQP